MNEFSEVQRFRTWWAWAVLIALNGLFIYAIIQQLVMGRPFGEKPAPDAVLVMIEIIPLSLLTLLAMIRLETRFDLEGIRYRYFPFQLSTRQIHWHELQDAYLREYHSFYEYGGWGIRNGSAATGKALNTSQSGRTGLQLVFHDGKRLLIGTAQPERIKPVLEKALAEGKVNRKV